MYWMTSLKAPTPEDLERVLARLGQPGANAYFFDRLQNPAWVEPLYDRGFFRRPPAADRSRDDGTVSLADWPELRYLLRMATLEPQVVGKILLKIPDTDNARVRGLMIEIGEHLSRTDAEKLAERIISWLDDPLTHRHFTKPVAPFIAHLLRIGATDGGLKVARRLFATADANGPTLDDWHFDRYLFACLPTLRERAPLPTLALLRDLLLDAKREPREGQLDDYSYIWRRDIERSNFTVKQIPDSLIDALRETALQLAQRGDIGLDAVLKSLFAREERGILMRIALFVASKLGDWNHSFIGKTLLNMRLPDRMTYRAEYAQLLQAAFPHLSHPVQANVLTAIESDPLQNISPERRAQLSAEELARWGRVVMRDRLSAFGSTLPNELTAARQALIGELGEFVTPASGAVWHGPTSPVPSDKLAEMALPEILQYLIRWIPTPGFGAPGREGLSRELHQLTKNRASEWSKSATEFEGLHPTYVRAFFAGLNDACGAKIAMTWPPVVALMDWVLSQPREAAVGHNALDEEGDPDWTWTRQTMARLLQTAFMMPEADLGWDLRDRLWSVLRELLKDQDPPPDTYDDNDPITTAINRVRGVAAHAMFRFAWWIHNHLPTESGPLTFDRMPEIRSGLDLVVNDPSPAVHSVLGDWFRTMFFFDSQWTVKNIDAIFPEQPDLRNQWQASWRAFVDYDQPYDPAFDTLLPKYELGLARLEAATSEDERKATGELGLGQHLMSYYWRGVGGERSRQLLLRYFDMCSPAAAAHVLWSAGTALAGPEPIAPNTITALRDLWTHVSAKSASWGELKQREIHRQFGTWFVSGRFDSAWSLQQLEAALQGGSGILDLESVLERMGVLTTEHPMQVAKLLELIVRDERDIWQPLLWQAQVEALLRALLACEGADVRAYAGSIANQLVRGGALFARNLLS
jgi:hypothetical protein